MALGEEFKSVPTEAPHVQHPNRLSLSSLCPNSVLEAPSGVIGNVLFTAGASSLVAQEPLQAKVQKPPVAATRPKGSG